MDIEEKTSEIKVYHQRLVVENVEDEEMEISLADAKAIKESFELNDLVDEEVSIAEFGRAAVILAKNVMKQKIREAEKENLSNVDFWWSYCLCNSICDITYYAIFNVNM